jgi:hypothetical protein
MTHTETYRIRDYRSFFLSLAVSLLPGAGIALLAIGTLHSSPEYLSRFGVLMIVIFLGALAFFIPCIAQMVFSVSGTYTLSYDDSSLTIERRACALRLKKRFKWSDIRRIGAYNLGSRGALFTGIGIQTKGVFSFGHELPEHTKRSIAEKLSEKLNERSTASMLTFDPRRVSTS